MAVTKLASLSATAVAAAIRQREVSAAALVEALGRRIEEREERLLAWVTLDLEGARRQAQALDRELASGRRRGPLHGVPVGVKDIFYTAGLPTRAGSPLYQNFVPSFDATSVRRLRQAGAIVLGKTHTTQLAYGDPAPTRNPWHREHTPGGSSSGSAAAVADRMVPAALGSQTAGSVLRPAAFCGIVGLKPTYGRIGRGGVFPLAWSLDHVGVLVRTVADAALLLSALAGPEPDDPTAAPTPVPDYMAAVAEPRPPRIGLVRRLFQERTEAAAWAQLEAAAQRLAAAGAAVEEAQPPSEFDAVLDVHHVVMAAEVAAYHGPIFHQRPDAYRPRLRAMIELGQLIPTAAYLHAQRARRHMARATLTLFDRYDVLLASAARGPAPRGLEWTGDPACNAPWTLFGFPALALPIGLDGQGLPLGAQVVAAPWQEARLLSAARWCEATLGLELAPRS
ncbi:MAG: amidase [Dehalococcoidia bacterium]